MRCAHSRIAQRSGADRQRRSGTSPGTERQRHAPRDIRGCDRKSQSQPRKAVKLPERTQHHDGQIGAQVHDAHLRLDVGKGFIDHQPSVTLLQSRRHARQRRAGGHTSVGIVGIHHHNMANRLRKIVEIRARDHLMAGHAPRRRVLIISWLNDRDRSLARQLRQPLNQRLGSWSCDDLGPTRHRIGLGAPPRFKASSSARDGKRCHRSAAKVAGTAHGQGLTPVDRSSHIRGDPPYRAIASVRSPPCFIRASCHHPRQSARGYDARSARR